MNCLTEGLRPVAGLVSAGKCRWKQCRGKVLRADMLVKHTLDCAIFPADACQTSIKEPIVLGHEARRSFLQMAKNRRECILVV